MTDNRWSGLGRGHGHLQSRRVTVRSRGGGVPDRTVDLWLPDQRLDVRVETGGHESPGYQTSTRRVRDERVRERGGRRMSVLDALPDLSAPW